MPWITINKYVDENGVEVEKQVKERPNHRTETRYMVRVAEGRFIFVNRNQMFDLVDALNDLCDRLEEGRF